ncbi:hypothetical protein GCM10009853_067010 [Glycomyces scopariae]
MTDPLMPLATDDPEIEARLRERADELSSQELAGFAHSLGVYPPGYSDDVDPPLVLTWPPGTDFDSPGLLVWDLRDDEE